MKLRIDKPTVGEQIFGAMASIMLFRMITAPSPVGDPERAHMCAFGERVPDWSFVDMVKEATRLKVPPAELKRLLDSMPDPSPPRASATAIRRSRKAK